MTTLALANPKSKTDNVIQISVVNGKLVKKPEVRYNKDGTIDKRHCNKVVGKDSEVYAFNTMEEIKTMIDTFNKRIKEAHDEDKKQIAYRNKLLFLIGINVGIRASDLRSLKWNFFLKNDGTFKEFYTFQPKKTKNKGKYVKLYFNNTVKKAITDYLDIYPVSDFDRYLFQSRKGDEPISVGGLWRIIKEAAEESGIEKNIGSHSLRKTWGYWVWHNAQDKNKALVMLQECFKHSSSSVTLRYIGLMDEEKKDMYESVDLGIDYI